MLMILARTHTKFGVPYNFYFANFFLRRIGKEIAFRWLWGHPEPSIFFYTEKA
jgi:hypothetical protein